MIGNVFFEVSISNQSLDEGFYSQAVGSVMALILVELIVLIDIVLVEESSLNVGPSKTLCRRSRYMYVVLKV